jgi:hypothetical protein
LRSALSITNRVFFRLFASPVRLNGGHSKALPTASMLLISLIVIVLATIEHAG